MGTGTNEAAGRLLAGVVAALGMASPGAWGQAESPAPAAGEVTRLPEVTVTGTREHEPLRETPAAVGIIPGETIRQDRPIHPNQIISQVPGAAVAVTNGEGHTTAIRQPFTTAPVYLFLEDGIPTRSTGFFNHNALYEINIPQSGGIEVTRGPGTALYGSDAIGGIVNVLTRVPPAEARGLYLGRNRQLRLVARADRRRQHLRRERLARRTSTSRTPTAGGSRPPTTARAGNSAWDRTIDAESIPDHAVRVLATSTSRPAPTRRCSPASRATTTRTTRPPTTCRSPTAR